MRVTDHNGIGEWSSERIQKRYAAYREAANLTPDPALIPHEHREGDGLWISPLMDEVIKRIETGDAASIALGVDLIEENQGMPFGKILKSNTARALRRSALNDSQKSRIRRRVVTMLSGDIVPHELQEYVKLLKRVGLEEYREILIAQRPSANARLLRFYRSLLDNETPLLN